MGFDQFRGNATTVTRLREMIARDHLPHAIILTGPRGAGKFTLAQMVAKAMNCLQRPIAADGLPDFCGVCRNCERIAQADALDQRFAEAVEARENLRESDKRETRIFVQTHPEVLVIPPDPPQMLVKVDQVRHVIGEMYYRPSEGRQKFYIFSESNFMKEAANALLKVLEEPPDFATLFLLAENSNALLPTIRSRCITLRLAPLSAAEIGQDLALRTEWTAAQKILVARLCAGAVGRARSFDLTGIPHRSQGRAAAADHGFRRRRPLGAVPRNRSLPRRGRRQGKDRPADLRALLDPRGPDVSQGRASRTDAQPGYPGGAGRHCRAGRL